MPSRMSDAVVGDHDAHGSSAVTTVPAAGRAGHAQTPVAAPRRGRPGRAGPEPCAASAPPTPSSAISIATPVAVRDSRTDAAVACGVLADVGQRLAGHEVQRELDGPRQRAPARRTTPPSAPSSAPRATPAPRRGRGRATAGWMPRASSRSSSSECASSSLARRRELLGLRGVAADVGRIIRSCSESATSRCWAPSCRSRSSRRRSASPAATMRCARRLHLGQPGLRLRQQPLVLERDRRRGARPPRPSRGRRRARRRRPSPRPRARRARSARSPGRP